MYCNNCGTYLPNDAVVCSNCGTRFDTTYIETYAPVPVDHNAYAAQFDKSDIGLNILSWFVPIFGIIYYFIKKDETPKKAKGTLKSALISTAVSLVLIIGCIAIASFTVFFMKNKVTAEINNQYNEYSEYYDDDDPSFVDDDWNNVGGIDRLEDGSNSFENAIEEDEYADSDINTDSEPLSGGEIKDGVYVNESANISFDLSDGWVHKTSDDIHDFEDKPIEGITFMKGTSVGMFFFMDVNGSTLSMDNVRSMFVQSYTDSFENIKVSDVEIVEIAGRDYESIDISGISLGNRVEGMVAISGTEDGVIVIIAMGDGNNSYQTVIDNINPYNN
jgi:hypothetical protein